MIEPPKLSRRAFMVWAAAAGFTGYLGGWYISRVRLQDVTPIIIAILRKHLGYLEVEKADLEQFARDFAAVHLDANQATLLSWVGSLRVLYRLNWLDIGAEEAPNLEETVVGHFLMSTDFFWNGADEARPVTYLGLYDPYSRPCSNPFFFEQLA